MDKKEIQKNRDTIIEAALPDVAFDGWSWTTLTQAAEKSGFSENTLRSLFPAKTQDALAHFSDMADRHMLETLKNINPEELRIRDRIKTALMARYQWLNEHKEALRQSLQYWALPSRKPKAAKIIWQTADNIWNWAGDTATDYNRFTKRGLLSGIIASATLVFLNDTNEDLHKTESFIDRRIENVMQLGKVINSFKKQA